MNTFEAPLETVSSSLGEKSYRGAKRLGAAMLGVVLATGAVWTVDNVLTTACEMRQGLAPNGHASPAPLCGEYSDFRGEISSRVAAATTNIIPNFHGSDPVFDPAG